MTENKSGAPPNAAPPVVIKPKIKNYGSGLEPGHSLRAHRHSEFKPAEEEVPEDVKLKRQIAKMSSSEWKSWVALPSNAQKLKDLNIKR